MLKTVKLSLVDRVVLNTLLTLNRDGSLVTARRVREIRRVCKLRDAAEAVEELREQAKAEGQPEPDWDTLAERGEVHDYALDDEYLNWLNERLNQHDWGKVQLQDGREIAVTVHPALLEAVADAADAVRDALVTR